MAMVGDVGNRVLSRHGVAIREYHMNRRYLLRAPE
jgi:hypothetical protein